MARTKLRIIIPALQVLILILAFSLDPLLSRRFVGRPDRSDLEVAYVVTPENLVLKLNFPLAILGLPVIYLLGRAIAEDTSSPAVALRTVIDLAIVTSTAAFWYLVVLEVEMRRRNASCLRFSGRNMERLKAAVLILIAVGAAAYALWDGYVLVVSDQLNRHRSFWSSVVANALVGGLFLVGWAAALITMGIQDIMAVSGPRWAKP